VAFVALGLLAGSRVPPLPLPRLWKWRRCLGAPSRHPGLTQNGDASFAMAAELANVGAACRAMRIHPSTYYRWKRQMDRYGPETLRPRERRVPRMAMPPVRSTRAKHYGLVAGYAAPPALERPAPPPERHWEPSTASSAPADHR
jgi:hypothetical protein